MKKFTINITLEFSTPTEEPECEIAFARQLARFHASEIAVRINEAMTKNNCAAQIGMGDKVYVSRFVVPYPSSDDLRRGGSEINE